jgi:hypothetical protein
MNKICLICERAFVGHFNAKFCTDDCRAQHKRRYELDYWRKNIRAGRGEGRIDPFPDNIERNAFGHWLSGFADGEATFGIRVCGGKRSMNYSPIFRIALRDDDTEILRLIQSFWGCGTLHFSDNARSKIPNAKPIAIYGVQRVSSHIGVVVPHFDMFPLRSKKRNDFAVWRKAVELMAEVHARPRVFRKGGGGSEPVWSSPERAMVDAYAAELRAARLYGRRDHQAPGDRTEPLYSCNEAPKSW